MVNQSVLPALDFANGPVLRVAIGLLVLGVVRALLLQLSDTIAAYLTLQDKRVFRRKLGMRALWSVFPSVVLQKARPGGSTGMFAYHFTLCCLSLILRLGVIIVPTLMVAHVYLLDRALGIRWATLPGDTTDVLAVVTIVAGVLLFLGRLYSPLVRHVEPAWSFFKPLILIAPFLTGFLAMHPQWSPLDWHFVMLLHVLSACAVLVLIPFGQLLTGMLTRLTGLVPEAEWLPPDSATGPTPPDAEAARLV
jgi:hypothetical protein